MINDQPNSINFTFHFPIENDDRDDNDVNNKNRYNNEPNKPEPMSTKLM